MRPRELLPVVGIGLCYALALVIQSTLPKTFAPGLAGLVGMSDRVAAMRWQIVKVAIVIGLVWGIFRKIPPQTVPTNSPKWEIVLGLLSIALVLLWGYSYWTGSNMGFPAVWIVRVQQAAGIHLPTIWIALALYMVPLLVFTISPYSWQDMGVTCPTKRDLAAWGVAFGVSFFVLLLLAPVALRRFFLSPLFRQKIYHYYASLIRLSWIFLAFLPEELLFRVYLQTRLEKFMPVGWAILLQGFLFNLSHLPQHALGPYGWGWAVLPHLAALLLIVNGVIGGYLWYKTRNLLMLVVVHLTLYPL